MNSSTQRAQALVDVLISGGVKHVVISPGSRNAPITYALARAEAAGKIQVHVRIDERVGAFTALGLSKVNPAAVVTTSGTAAANLYPAILEAYHSNVGLIAITADRPHDLRGVGANQTTEQVGMFSPAISTVDLATDASLSAVVNHSSRLLAQAHGVFGAAKPVHLNIAFREPLTPHEPTPGVYEPIASSPRISADFRFDDATTVDVTPPTVVVAGDGAGAAAGIFAEDAGLPLLAEPSSGVRGSPVAVSAYQLVLPDLAPQVQQVIVFGRPTLSRAVSSLIANAEVVRVVAQGPDWVDITGSATSIHSAVWAQPGPREWLNHWLQAGQAALGTADSSLATHVVRHCLSQGHPQAMLGSSMTVRYADIYAPVGQGFTSSGVYASRGLAGIDGTISTAMGIALASGPIRTIMGDLTFFHDVGALLGGRLETPADIEVVVLNDHGGGIFATLEHGHEEYRPTFSRFFASPVGVEVEDIARACGYGYVEVSSAVEISEVFSSTIRGQRIVEVKLGELSDKTL